MGGERSRPRSIRSPDAGYQQSSDKVTVKVYAEGEDNLVKAIKQLQKTVKDEWIVSDFKDPVLLTLPQKKVRYFILVHLQYPWSLR